MNDRSCHSQTEKSPSNVLEKFADARILPFYMELNGTDKLCTEPRKGTCTTVITKYIYLSCTTALITDTPIISLYFIFSSRKRVKLFQFFGKYFLLKHCQATGYDALIFPHFLTNIKDKINWKSLFRTFWAAFE